jgi:glycosyltransferase involved in cell wall biosynthesis
MLEQQARRLGIADRVEFAGHAEPSELEARLAPAWVQVAPGRLVEPFGLAAAEALMRGTAVVASSTGGPSQLVRKAVAGKLVPPGDENALSEALRELLTDREHCEALGAAGRAWALEHLGLDAHVDRLLSLYEETIAA